MTIDDFTKIATSITGILNAVAWPVVAVCVIRKFSPLIRDFLANMTEGTVKAFGVEATAKRNAAVEIAKADLIKSEPGLDSETFEVRAEKSLRSAEAATGQMELRRLSGKHVLVVVRDGDEPVFEINALQQLGMLVSMANHPRAALASIERSKPDIVVIVASGTILEHSQQLIETMLSSRIPYVIYGEPKSEDPVTVAAVSTSMAVTTKASELALTISRAMNMLSGTSDWMHSYVDFVNGLKSLRNDALTNRSSQSRNLRDP
jgi:hypothetical protein